MLDLWDNSLFSLIPVEGRQSITHRLVSSYKCSIWWRCRILTQNGNPNIRVMSGYQGRQGCNLGSNLARCTCVLYNLAFEVIVYNEIEITNFRVLEDAFECSKAVDKMYMY